MQQRKEKLVSKESFISPYLATRKQLMGGSFANLLAKYSGETIKPSSTTEQGGEVTNIRGWGKGQKSVEH